jgi:hypothetical protein
LKLRRAVPSRAGASGPSARHEAMAITTRESMIFARNLGSSLVFPRWFFFSFDHDG